MAPHGRLREAALWLRRRRSATPAEPFDPLADPDLVGMWLALDATDNGTTLTQPDRSVNAFHATATGGTGRATIDATGFAGQRAINFSAMISGNAPLLTTGPGALLSGRQQFTVLTLAGHHTSTASGYLARYGVTGASGDWHFRARVPGAGQLEAQLFQSATHCEIRGVTRAETLLYPKVVCARFDGSLTSGQVVDLRQNGRVVGTTYPLNGANTVTLSSKTLYFGSSSNGSSPFAGRWGGCAIVRRLLSASEVATWSQWMRQQYSIGTPRQVLWVGDSITAADTSPSPSFRKQIDDLYVADRGTLQPWGAYETIGPLGADTDWPGNWHDGVSGTTITDITTRMATTLVVGGAYDPDCIAFLAGANDILADADAATIATRWQAMLEATYDLRPNAKIKLLNMINNTTSAPRTAVVAAANALKPDVIAAVRASRPGILVEDVQSASATVSLADGTHPDAAGAVTLGSDLYPRIMAW